MKVIETGKRGICLLLSVLLVLGCVSGIGAPANAETYKVQGQIPTNLDTAKAYPWYGGAPAAQWAKMTETGEYTDVWPDWTDVAYAEIVAEGNKDAGALHMVNNAKHIGVGITSSLVAGQQYTLGLWAKGSSTSDWVLWSFGHGDANVIGDGSTLKSDWTYYEATITATPSVSQLSLVARGGDAIDITDIYIDNVTLKDDNGVDLLAGKGDFCTYGEVTKDSDVTGELRDAAFLDTSKVTDLFNQGLTADQWVPFSPLATFDTVDATNYKAWEAGVNIVDVVADGSEDAGALHFVSNGTASLGVVINPGMTVGGVYTLGMWIKNAAGAAAPVLQMYANGDGTITEGYTASTGWTYIEKTFTANLGSMAIKTPNWGTAYDFYLDNISLKDAGGNELLNCAGNLCHKAVTLPAKGATCTEPGLTEGKVCSLCDKVYTAQTEISALGHSYGEVGEDGRVVCANCGEAKKWADIGGLDTSKAYPWYGGAPAAQWAKMTETGEYTDAWPDWTDVAYAEIVAEGNKDAGALHIVNAGKFVGVGITAGMEASRQYTLGLWAKGSSNATSVLLSYGNGDVEIVGNNSSVLGADWTYYEATVTNVQVNQLNLAARDWGTTDIYIDNITLKDDNGVDLLAGKGDFTTEQAPEPTVSATLATLDTSKAYSWVGGAPGNQWAKMTETGAYTEYWPDWNETTYAQIVADGYQDAGALHIVNGGKNAGVGITVSMVAGQQYTLGLWAKGSSNSGSVLLSFGNGDVEIIGNSTKTLGSDWTYYEVAITNVQANQLSLVARDWGVTDIYIDNVTLVNADGVDLLAGYGDFFIVENTDTPNVPVDDVVSGTADAIDTTRHAWNGLAHMDAWTPFFPAGISADTGWNEWNESNYAQIAAIGKTDAGALHFVGNGENVGVAVDAGLIPGQTYVLKAYVKGYAYTFDGGLRMYGNGEGFVAKFGYHQQLENNANWAEVTHTFVATGTALQLYVPGTTGTADIYVDDLRILDTNGSNILEDKGNFSTVTENTPDLAVISPEAERSYRWYLNGTTLTPSADSNVQIIAQGHKDPGALYLWQNRSEQATMLTLVSSQAKDRTNNEKYTLKLDVKGVFGNDEQISVFPGYITQNEAKENYNISTELKELLGVTGAAPLVVSEWTTLSWELPYNDGDNGFTYLYLYMGQYTYGTRCYIDNIRVLDPDGNDVLGGAGNFMDSGSESYPIRLVKPEVEVQNSGTMYYMGYFDNASVNVKNHEEKVLLSTYTFGDQNFSVTHNGATQTASNKNVTMNMASTKDGMPVIFSITSNKGILVEDKSRVDEINIYDVTFSNYSNAEKSLPLGRQELGFAWDDADGYIYTYTAPQKGTLAVTVESGNVSVLLNGAAAESIDVNGGDTVTVQVKPNPNANGGYEATDAVINSSWIVNSPSIASASLVLGSVLDLNITVNPGSTGTAYTLQAAIGSDDLSTVDFANGVFTIKLPAHRLYEGVTLNLLSGGNIVDTETWTMEAYSAAIRKESAENTKLLTLLGTLEQYGKFADYFADPANTAKPDTSSIAGVKRSDLNGFKCSIPVTNSSLGAVAGLYLDDACDLTVKFNAAAWGEGYQLLVNGTAVETTAADGKICYTKPGLIPQEWSDIYNFKVVDGEGNTVFAVNYCVLSYAYTCLGKTQELQEGLNDLLKAMYLYNAAATAYIAG